MSKDKAKERAFYALDMAIRADNDGEAVAKFEIARKMMANSSITLHDVHPKVKIESEPDAVTNGLRKTILDMEDRVVLMQHTVQHKEETIRELQTKVRTFFAAAQHLRLLLTKVAPRVSGDDDLIEDILDAIMTDEDDALPEIIAAAEIDDAYDDEIEAEIDEEADAEAETEIVGLAHEEPAAVVLTPSEATLHALVRYRPTDDLARLTAIALAEGCSFNTLKSIFVRRSGSAYGWMKRIAAQTGYSPATIAGWRREGFVSAAAVRIVVESFKEPEAMSRNRRTRARIQVAGLLHCLISEIAGRDDASVRELVLATYGKLYSADAIAYATRQMREYGYA